MILSRLVQPSGLEQIIKEFSETRKNTMDLFKPLKTEDAVIQSNDFGSPPNWHIAHVTWFFHQILNKYNRDKNIIRSNAGQINLRYLNSYYQKYGEILPKSERGRFPRPTVQDTLRYRTIIENEIIAFLSDVGKRPNRHNDDYNYEEVAYHITLGNQHEMQHQELMVYDFQHYFQRFEDPDDNYKPILKETITNNVGSEVKSKRGSRREAIRNRKDDESNSDDSLNDMNHSNEMIDIPGGLYDLGFCGEGFCYDNELPEHKVHLNSFRLDKFPVTNGQYIEFIEDGGYENYRYWLADGWELVQDKGWNAPLYWEFRAEDSSWIKKDFRGVQRVDPQEPVTNVSYYEADAYAKWAKKRLPTEAEWEKAASWDEEIQKKLLYPWGDDKPTPVLANTMDSYLWGPSKVGSYPQGKSYYGCHQMIGDVWEWTSSEYVLYPGYESKFEEYTDKWAINQKVLRGGCFATPSRQIRNSYRNYFRPHDRILFSGFRCAKDI
ncbi:MAG TPA: ergothioneine biosynthesis protein EgtB [Nitrososphaeraceae archaeon]